MQIPGVLRNGYSGILVEDMKNIFLIGGKCIMNFNGIVRDFKLENIDKKKLRDDIKLLLELYRKVDFHIQDHIENLDNIFYETKRKRLDDIVLSVLEIDKDIDIEKVESQLLNTQQSIFLLKLMDDALSRLSAYPNKGEIYADIITYKYFDKRIRSNEEISEMLLISRSTYYRYMNKAILIFGVMLFGYSIFDRFYEEQLNEKLKVAEDKIDYKIEL